LARKASAYCNEDIMIIITRQTEGKKQKTSRHDGNVQRAGKVLGRQD
jgi:hypothetical protein